MRMYTRVVKNNCSRGNNMKSKKKRLIENIVNRRAKLIESYAWERKPGAPLPTLEDTMARHQGKNPVREQESPMENDIINDLKNILTTWETKEYASDKARWQEYYQDIEKVVNEYTGA